MSPCNDMFNFLRNCQTVFQCMYAILHFQINVVGFQSPHLLLSLFLMIAILVGKKLYLIVILICISQISKNIIFSCACLTFLYLLWRYVPSNPPITFNLAICPFIIELQEFFTYSRCKSLIRYVICKYFLQ